jgi:dolichol-phosphate mannosyltransferase
MPRLLARRGDALDVALAAIRLGTLAGTSSAYLRRSWPFWTSPAADLVAVAALVHNIARPHQPWKQRSTVQSSAASA